MKRFNQDPNRILLTVFLLLHIENPDIFELAFWKKHHQYSIRRMTKKEGIGFIRYNNGNTHFVRNRYRNAIYKQYSNGSIKMVLIRDTRFKSAYFMIEDRHYDTL